MSTLARLHAFFAVPIRYFWITLLIPSLFALKFLFPPFGSVADYPAAWIVHFVPLACMLIPIQLLYAHLPERMRPADPASLRAVPFHTAVIGVCGVVGWLIGAALVSPLYPPAEQDPTHEWPDTPLVMLLAVLIGTPVFLRGINYRERLQESRMRELRAQRATLSAQVQALQARIEPHFLFNSLNTVASLIGEDPDRAERALEKIADLFRYTLDAANQPFVVLARELESVETFLELEKLRFPDQLETSVRVEPGTGQVPVPPLFLQPLVENAARHGIAARSEHGRIEVEIGRSSDELRVRVEDDGPGPGGSPHRGAGTALADLRTRLNLLYGNRASLEIDSGTMGGCRVTIRFPLHAPPVAEPEGA